ncbi:hypothetical protein CLAIMM_15141 [Cladophialophora immunda]|nr:hypothetical protein CLAIMM_15141 [Cladophialophora immunda]
MSTRPRREPTPSRRLLEARAAAVTTRSNPPISTPTPPRTLSPASRELALPTPVPPRPGTTVPGSAGTAGGGRPSQTLRLTFNASTWARSPVPSAVARQPVPQFGRLTTEEAQSVALQALRARPTTERSQTSRSSQWLFKSQFLEDEDEFNSSSDLDELNNSISSHSGQISKRPRSGGVVMEEVAEDMDISIPPPSHQPQTTEQRKRHKKTSTTRQTESPDIEVFEMSKVLFKIITSVMVGRSLELSAEDEGTQMFDINIIIHAYQRRLETKYPPSQFHLNPPAFGGELSLLISGRNQFKLNCQNDQDFERFAERWWEVLHEPRRQRHTIQVSLTIRFEARPVTPPPPILEDVTQARRRRDEEQRSRPSASQRQRQSIAANESLNVATGDVQIFELTTKWKCQSDRCPNYGRTCLPTDEGHIRIDTPSIRQWFDSIRNSIATIEEMPGSLLLRLMKDKSNYMNKKAIKAAANGAQIASNGGGVHIQFFQGSGDAIAKSDRDQQSSPPFRPGDDDNNVILYLDWLGRRYPSYRAEFGEIKGILQAEGWGFSDLRTITDSAWERMEIRGGFVTKLKKNLKVFANEELQPEEASTAAATDDLSLLP